jgi:hypothetical protein
MNTLKGLTPEVSNEVIRSVLSRDPRFIQILNELRSRAPKTLIQQAEVFEEWVLDAVMDELKSSIETIDSVALANALLSNKVLQGKLAVPLNDIASGFSERLKADIKEQMHNEINTIHNLLTARKAKDKADKLEMQKKRDEMKFERDIAIAKGELIWFKISSLPVAGPALTIALIIGVLIGLNYPINIQCYKGDQICGFRLGKKVEK